MAGRSQVWNAFVYDALRWLCLQDSICFNIFSVLLTCCYLSQITQQLESLPEEYKTVVCDVINSRRSDIRQQLLADSHSISHSVMTDFDWKLKVIQYLFESHLSKVRLP